MGDDKIRHLLAKGFAGAEHYYWNPSKSLRLMGMDAEPLGVDWAQAKARALELNKWADEMRACVNGDENVPPPNSIARLFSEFRKSIEFRELKSRTQKDYTYYLEKIESEFGHLAVRALTARVIKSYYYRVRDERGVTWAYHILSTLRAVLSWAVSEDWILKNPALDVRMKSPPKRTITWQPQQAQAYIDKAIELGWHSVAVMAIIFDCIAQSPIDVRTLKRGAYNGRTISVTRTKTDVQVSPVPLWKEAKKALDGYLKSRPDLLPDTPIFVHDRLKMPWVESTLHKVHAEIRTAAKLPKHLQLQDFRRTAQTEAGAAGGTVDEIRALAQHSTRKAGEHYVHPDERFAAAVQGKRLASRNGNSPKVRNSG